MTPSSDRRSNLRGDLTPARFLLVQSDGASRGNPGPSGAGAILRNERGEIVQEVSRYIGRATNNQAEYQALVMALEAAIELGAEEVELLLDSELIVKQIEGAYRVRSPLLQPLFSRVQRLLRCFRAVRVRHISRRLNGTADLLANQAIDRQAGNHR